MTKNSHSATQGQPFSTQDRGKLDEKSVQTDTNTDLSAKTTEKTGKSRENSGNFDKKSDDLRHRVEDFSQNANISDGESADILHSFAKDFGKSYRADELSRCSLSIEKIRAREQKLLKESAKKKRVIFTVAICASLAVVILII